MKSDKYQLAYTLKMPGKQGMNSKLFKSKTNAEKWIHENESQLYWHQLTEINATSNKLKIRVDFEPPKDMFVKKSGTLDTHFETGMECLGLIFNEDGIHGPPNPDFDPSKPESHNNFKYFGSYEAMTYITSGQVIELEDGTRWGMAKDRDFASRDGYRLSFYPQGFSREELLKMFYPGNLKVSLYIPIKSEDTK